MARLNVLVISATAETGAWLAARLSPHRFAVTTAQPGPDMIRAVREGHPGVAVVDAIHARPGMAQMEVALLKHHSPNVQIVALSEQSSERDGDVIEQGVFCYLAGCTRDDLLRVIEAAAHERRPSRSISSNEGERGSNP